MPNWNSALPSAVVLMAGRITTHELPLKASKLTGRATGAFQDRPSLHLLADKGGGARRNQGRGSVRRRVEEPNDDETPPQRLRTRPNDAWVSFFSHAYS